MVNRSLMPPSSSMVEWRTWSGALLVGAMPFMV
jgi:hypothetical protein